MGCMILLDMARRLLRFFQLVKLVVKAGCRRRFGYCAGARFVDQNRLLVATELVPWRLECHNGVAKMG